MADDRTRAISAARTLADTLDETREAHAHVLRPLLDAYLEMFQLNEHSANSASISDAWRRATDGKPYNLSLDLRGVAPFLSKVILAASAVASLNLNRPVINPAPVLEFELRHLRGLATTARIERAMADVVAHQNAHGAAAHELVVAAAMLVAEHMAQSLGLPRTDANAEFVATKNARGDD